MDTDSTYRPPVDDQTDADMEEAQLRLEQLRKEKEEVENSRRRLEEINILKNQFMAQQNELGLRMSRATGLLAREVESLRQESNELEQIHQTLSVKLRTLGTIKPDDWPIEHTEKLIDSSRQTLDHCEEEYADAIQRCTHMQHTKVLNGVRRAGRIRLTYREFMTQFLQGLSFHLPLLLIAAIIILLIWLLTPAV